MKKRLGNNRGVSFIEVLMSLVIMGIIISSANVVFVQTYDLLERNTTHDKMFYDFDKTHNILVKEFSKYASVEVLTEGKIHIKDLGEANIVYLVQGVGLNEIVMFVVKQGSVYEIVGASDYKVVDLGGATIVEKEGTIYLTKDDKLKELIGLKERDIFYE